MAITFHTIPKPFTTSDNPVTYVFSSNMTAQANFFYRIETWLNGQIASVDDLFPEVSGRSHIDISPIIKNLIPNPRVINNITSVSGTVQSIYIKVFEYYGTPPVVQASGTATLTYAFKGSISDEDFLTKDFDVNYKLQKFLTNIPRGKRISVLKGQDVIMSMICGNVSTTTKLKFYDNADVLLGGNNLIQTHILRQINMNHSLLAVLQPTIADDIAWYSVQINDSEVLEFEYLKDYCFQPHSLLWMNNYGSFEHYIFTHNKTESGRIESASSYQKPFGAWDGTSFAYSLENSGHKEFFKKVSEEGTLSSDYITQSVQNWLVEECYKSTFHLLYNPSGYKLPIYITETAYKKEQDRFEELLSEEVKYKKSNTNKFLTT